MEHRTTANVLEIHMTNEEAEALGEEVADLVASFASVLSGLAALRRRRVPEPLCYEGSPRTHRRDPRNNDVTWCQLIIDGPRFSQHIDTENPTCDLCAAPDYWGSVIRSIARLTPRLEGVSDAAVRTWATYFGGTHGQLAAAMGVPRSTAQSRRETLMGRDPGEWEWWACPKGFHPLAAEASPLCPPSAE